MSVQSEQVEVLYCICRSSCSNKFMIGCDGCDEWFHGSCINISSEMAKDIECYFCPICVEKNPTLKTVYKSKKKKIRVEEEEMRRPKLEIVKKKHDFPTIPKIEKDKGRHDKSEERRRAEKREEAQRKLEQERRLEKEARRKEKEKAEHKERKLKEKRAKEEAKEKKVFRPRIIEESDEDEDNDAEFDLFLSSIAPKPQKESSEEDVDVEEVVEDVKKKKKKVPKKRQSTNKTVQVEKVSEESSEEEPEKQCLGPNCCHATRRGSNYCCEECGIQLALKRIRTFLPERKPSLTTKSKAETIDAQLIKNLELQQEVAHQKIAELNCVRKNIMKLIEKARTTTSEEGSDPEDEDEEIEGEMTDCVTCGMPYPTRTAVRHMERCYNKFEAQVSLGSAFKCSIQWESMFCDVYDRQQGAYCKKLRVLCPDHNKDKEDHDGVCGCPLDVTDLTPNTQICSRSKKSCTRHISWEKIRLGEVDMERVHYFLKLEESFEEMRKVMCRLANRNNLMQVLLNGTIVHDSRGTL